MGDHFAGRTIVPMKGAAGDLPRGPGWIYEIKWDGMRIVAFIEHDGVRLQSTNGRDVTASFPELQSLRSLGENLAGLILDGEVVAFEGATPSFNALQRRMHVADPSEARRRAAITPVIYVAFDLLHLDGHDLLNLPLESRRSLLEQLGDDAPQWTICEQHVENVDGLIDAVGAAGLEGVMAKRSTSTYRPGQRSSDWVKFKPRMRQEFVVGGWLGGRGRRQGGLGSLLVGVYDDAENLHFAGRAGSGLTDETQATWLEVLTERPASPFVDTPAGPNDRALYWCDPIHVVEIAFNDWAPGKHLRHPVVLGRRTDKDPMQVRREA